VPGPCIEPDKDQRPDPRSRQARYQYQPEARPAEARCLHWHGKYRDDNKQYQVTPVLKQRKDISARRSPGQFERDLGSPVVRWAPQAEETP
jgi:hypothetical protein